MSCAWGDIVTVIRFIVWFYNVIHDFPLLNVSYARNSKTVYISGEGR